MPSARYPFLKDPPPEKPTALTLALVESARHSVYSPLCCAPRLSQFPKSPLHIQFPWVTEIVKEGAAKSFMEQVMAEHRESNPDINKPTSLDLIRWYRQRAIDAEMHAGGLDSEVNRLEGVNERLEREIGQMTIDMRIRSASHGV